MPLTVGDKLGPHEILAPIGKSAWARCIAHKERLRRDVSIKVSNNWFYRALHASRIDYTGRAEGGDAMVQAPPGSAWFHIFPETTLLERGRSTRARRLPSPSCRIGKPHSNAEPALAAIARHSGYNRLS